MELTIYFVLVVPLLRGAQRAFVISDSFFVPAHDCDSHANYDIAFRHLHLNRSRSAPRV